MTWKPLSFGLCKKRANNEIRGGNSNYCFFTNWKEGYYRVTKTLWVTLYRCKNRLWVSKYKSWKGHGKKSDGLLVCVWLCDMRSSGMRYEECERFGNGFLLRAPPLNLDSLWPIVVNTTRSELMLNHTKGVYGYSSFCAFSLWHRLCTLHRYEFLNEVCSFKLKTFSFISQFFG